MSSVDTELFRSPAETVLRPCGPEIGSLLIQWIDNLAALDVDYIIFMARKSFCVYDVLLRVGASRLPQVVLSDRVLDLNLNFVRGKRIALIDDTLILGTSIHAAAKSLRDAGAAVVESHVFARDLDWHAEFLVKPDSTVVDLNEAEMRSLCGKFVQAMSLASRPYSADFPIVSVPPLSTDDLDRIGSDPLWQCYRIGGSLDPESLNQRFSIFPNIELFHDLFGYSRERLPSIDICKIRVYVQSAGDFPSHFVPMVTLAPLSVSQIDDLFLHLCETLAAQRKLPMPDIEVLRRAIRRPTARQRLVQYFLSRGLIERMMLPGHDVQIIDAESSVHWGPTLTAILDQLSGSYSLLMRSICTKLSDLEPAPTPNDAKELAREILVPIPFGNKAPAEEDLGNDIDLELNRIFQRIYDGRELDARRSIHESADNIDEALKNSRLNTGLSWQQIVQHVCASFKLDSALNLPQMLSLALDRCVDAGVAVPITRVTEDNIVFRAYRHGEDVLLTDVEFDLMYEVMRGYIDGYLERPVGDGGEQRDPVADESVDDLYAIPRLDFEKLLVLACRIGLQQSWLRPNFSETATGDMLKIGFDRMGARVVLKTASTTLKVAEPWFVSRLVDRGIVEEDEQGKYSLGHKLNSPAAISADEESAYSLGMLFGFARRKSPDGSGLRSRDLVMMSSCDSPRYLCAALEAEVEIVEKWIESSKYQTIKNVPRHDHPIVLKFLSESRSPMPAIHQARFKYVGNMGGAPEIAWNAGRQQLALHSTGRLLVSQWDGFRDSLSPSDLEEQRSIFDPIVDRSMSVFLRVASAVTLLEVCALREFPDEQIGALNKLFEISNALIADGSVTADLETSRALRALGATDNLQISSPKPPSDYLKAWRHAVELIDSALPDIKQLRFSMVRASMRYDQKVKCKEFLYALWFDVVDSRARSPKSGISRREYEYEVRSFIQAVVESLQRQIFAVDPDRRPHAKPASFETQDDGMTIFFTKDSEEEDLTRFLQAIRSALDLYPSVKIRLGVGPTDFTGNLPFKYPANDEVIQKDFWHTFVEIVRKIETTDYSDEARAFGLIWKPVEIQSVVKMSDPEWNRISDVDLFAVDIGGSFVEIAAQAVEWH